jgi:hypothetical protein
MADPNSNETGKTIWSYVTLGELVDAIASLGDRLAQLKDETWRINDKTSSSSSLWNQVIDKCKHLKHNEQTRISLYKIWRVNRHKIRDLVEEKQSPRDRNQDPRNDNDASVAERNSPVLLPDPSLPLPERPNTRVNQAKNADDNDNQSSVVREGCISFTPIEWKNVFSRTNQKMKPGWRKAFYDKLTSIGIKCSVSIEKPHIKKGKRKRNCKFFGFNGTCTIGICPRMYQVILQNEPDGVLSALFLVKIYKEENHDRNIETSALQLRGEERLLVGKKFHCLFQKLY